MCIRDRGTIDLLGVTYPLYRFLIIVAGLAVAAGCYVLIHRTRLGMLIRAGSTDRMMVGALGVNIARLNTLLFVLGAVLAGVAGLMAGPILSAQTGMGEPILILTLVAVSYTHLPEPALRRDRLQRPQQLPEWLPRCRQAAGRPQLRRLA